MKQAWLGLLLAVTLGVEAEQVALDIKTPKPMFAGTPRELKTPNLEPPRKAGEKRPPVMVPAGVVNLAKGKEVTSSDMEPMVGELELITDGVKDGEEGCFVELSPGKQWVQIDLGKVCEIDAVVIWHYHSQARVYRDIVVQTADDPDFITNVKTVFNNDHDNSSGLGVGKDKDYIDTFEGRGIAVPGVKGRYVRLWSNGNTSDDMNHYIEVEVFGR